MAIRRVQDILTPDPAYTGAFEAKEEATVSPTAQPQRAPDAAPASASPPVERRPAPPATERVPAAAPQAPSATAEPPPAPSGRKARVPVSVRIRPTVEQAGRIATTGLRTRDVLQAAWRQAVVGYRVGPDYVEPQAVARAGGPGGLFDTTLMVDAEPLEELARMHDPLRVKGSWWLIRGQIEPAFWAAIDDVLARIAARK